MGGNGRVQLTGLANNGHPAHRNHLKLSQVSSGQCLMQFAGVCSPPLFRFAQVMICITPHASKHNTTIQGDCRLYSTLCVTDQTSPPNTNPNYISILPGICAQKALYLWLAKAIQVPGGSIEKTTVYFAHTSVCFIYASTFLAPT